MSSTTGFADLHLHTSHSDSTLSPAELVRQAHAAGLQTIAITDHDCLDGIAPAVEAAHDFPIRVIPGVEITAYFRDGELHVVGLFLNPQHDELVRELAALRGIRRERISTMAARLQHLGLPIRAEEVHQQARGSSVGRAHVAQALLMRGYVGSIAEAFNRYIGDGGPAYVPKPRWSIQKAVALIRRAGGLAVLAHPGNYNLDPLLPMFLGEFDAIEVFCPMHAQPHVDRYNALAARFRLGVSGGSDDHGEAKDQRLLGQVKLPAALVEALEARLIRP